MGELIKIEFKRWETVEVKEFEGQTYRISKFAPKGQLKGYYVGIKDSELGDWLPIEGLLDGHGSVEDARQAIEDMISYWNEAKSELNGTCEFGCLIHSKE